jgi:muramoyltetrapeptide carboxypeptidase
VSGFRKSPLDRGYSMKAVVERIRAATRTPVLTGLPFGHVPTKVTLPVGAKVRLVVDGRQAYIGWH